MSFHNPYHFVPLGAPAESKREGDVSREDFEKGEVPHLRHDRYAPGTFSGRIRCRVVCETPVFIGNQRSEATARQPAKVTPFRLDGEPAIPSSSLRGMISSIAEAASNSAMRILDNRPYSYRVPVEKSRLSAIGMVIKVAKEGEPDQYWLQPLTLPTIPTRRAGSEPIFHAPQWRTMFPKPNLKVYFGTRETVREEAFQDRYQTYRVGGEYYGLKLPDVRWSGNGRIAAPSAALHWTSRGASSFLLAQKSLDRSDPIPWEEGLSEKGYTRGILRVLGHRNRPDIPNTRKHEVFIPYPPEMEGPDEPWRLFAIDLAVISRFHDLADERTEARKEGSPLPYEPYGTARCEDESEVPRFRLKTGDLVFFGTNTTGDEVSEVSLSSIWRGRVDDGGGKAVKTFHFIRSVDPELVPFHKDRQWLTPAEQIFGFVEERDDKRKETPERRESSLALASRVRFSHAWLSEEGRSGSSEDPFGEPVTLKILATPKPPSPTLYFKRKSGDGQPIGKAELNQKDHTPQGRKFYLHQPSDGEPWRSERTDPSDEQARLKQKVEIEPIREGTAFEFDIDFFNLTRRELALLAYSLRPTDEFRHKIGMGKPIGLGTIRIDPQRLDLVDRQTRYSLKGLMESRYVNSWVEQADGQAGESQQPDSGGQSVTATPSLKGLAAGYHDAMNCDIREALHAIGDPRRLQGPVHYPAVKGHRPPDLEAELFEWFVVNEGLKDKGESLTPLNRHTQRMPLLKYHPPKG